jgi:hypothetical protein
LYSVTFSENRAVYEIMLKNKVEPDRPQTIRRMHVACWISKATHTQARTYEHACTYPRERAYTRIYSEIYNTYCFPQQLFRECASILRNTYIACFVDIFLQHLSLPSKWSRNLRFPKHIRVSPCIFLFFRMSSKCLSYISYLLISSPNTYFVKKIQILYLVFIRVEPLHHAFKSQTSNSSTSGGGLYLTYQGCMQMLQDLLAIKLQNIYIYFRRC